MKESAISAILSLISEGFGTRTRDDLTYLRTPFLDLDGDPIELALEESNGELWVDDGRRLAALLFQLDQEGEGSPGFKLIKSLASAHGMEIDFNEGTVGMTVSAISPGRDLWIMAQVVASVCQALPHMELREKRRPSLGPRLRRRVRSTLQSMRVLELVEQRHRISGKRVESWVIDFYYTPVRPLVRAEPGHEVIVNTVDLDVADPIPKAEHAITLAMDVKQGNPKAAVRVIYDTHGRDSQSEQASQLIDGYGEELGYAPFNYRAPEQYSKFKSLVEQEIFPDASAWLRLRG